jgi:hypothetical protein
MISSIRRGALLAGSIACLGVAGAAVAQPAPSPPGAAQDGGQHHWRDGAMRDPAVREAEHAKRLHEILQLRPEQDGALHAYLDALNPAGDEMRKDHNGMRGEGMTTPQRLDHMLAHFDEMRTRIVARVEATKTFYAQLSPEQQKAFDAMAGGMGRHGHDHGGWRHGDHGKGPDGQGPGAPGGDGPHG